MKSTYRNHKLRYDYTLGWCAENAVTGERTPRRIFKKHTLRDVDAILDGSNATANEGGQ